MLASWFSDHVWFNKASIPNISFLGSLEVAQIHLPGWLGGFVGGLPVIIELVAVQLDWH